MATVTKTEPPAKAWSPIGLLGLACLMGWALWLLLNITETFDLPLGLEDPLGVLLLVGLMGGPLGLLTLQVAGSGRMGRIGSIGAVIALLGLLSYLAGHLIESLFGFTAEEIGIFYAVGALLVPRVRKELNDEDDSQEGVRPRAVRGRYR